MSEACPLDLNYGHLGKPVYDSKTHGWEFSRHPQIARQFKPLGEPINALPPGFKYAVEGPRNATERVKGIKELTARYPELQPAASLLRGLAQISEAVNQATSSHEPSVSELLAIGQADSSTKHRRSEPVPIIAVAGGPAGEAVRLVLMKQEQLGWGRGQNTHLNNLTSKGGEQSSWIRNGSPIQQLVFAESGGQSSSWLAVRYHGAVSILRPRFRPNDITSCLRSTTALESRLDPNPIVHLSTQRSRGVPFADVSFNPWNHQQIATIDQGGCWTIWTIQSISSERGVRTIEKGSGGYVIDDKGDEEQSGLSGDGWGSIMWAGSSTRLVVATREKFTVFDVENDVTRLDVPNLLLKKPVDWILDIKRKPSDDGSVFVATSTTLYWIAITSPNDFKQLGAKCLLSWKHFIDHEDISLRLNVLHVPENVNAILDTTVTTLLLYSRLNGLVLVFTLQYAKSSTDRAISTSDPFLLPHLAFKERNPKSLAARSDAKRFNVPIASMVIRAIPYSSSHNKPASGLGQTYFERRVKFHQVNVLYHDLSLSECLYAEATSGSDIDIQLPNSRSRRDVVKASKHLFDDFIAPNGFEIEDFEETVDDDIGRQWERAPSPLSAPSNEGARSINFEWLEKALRRTPSAYTATTTEDFDDVLQDLYDRIEYHQTTIVTTLLDLISRDISIGDVDAASAQFKDFLSDNTQLVNIDIDDTSPEVDKQPAVSTVMTPPTWRSLGLDRNPHISELYDSLIEIWISSLAQNVPTRIRISFEKSLRSLAAQMCLSSYVTNSDLTGQEGGTTQDKASATSAGAQFVLPVRRRASIASLEKGKQPAKRTPSPPASLQVSEDAGFQPSSPPRALPTPEPTPSIHSQSSISSVAADPANQYLQAYADLISQPSLPSQLSNIVDHWQIGADPENYDWEAALQAFASEDEEELEAHAKQQERAEKRRKRQREPTVGSSSQPLPKRKGISQPERAQEETQGSSQTTEGLLIASQVEPGRFGGRPGKAKKKKASELRRPGFK